MQTETGRQGLASRYLSARGPIGQFVCTTRGWQRPPEAGNDRTARERADDIRGRGVCVNVRSVSARSQEEPVEVRRVLGVQAPSTQLLRL